MHEVIGLVFARTKTPVLTKAPGQCQLLWSGTFFFDMKSIECLYGLETGSKDVAYIAIKQG